MTCFISQDRDRDRDSKDKDRSKVSEYNPVQTLCS